MKLEERYVQNIILGGGGLARGREKRGEGVEG